MLNSGKKIRALRDKQKKKILTLVLSKKNFLNETKNHNPPPFKLNGRSLNVYVIHILVSLACLLKSLQHIEV